jgi:hypothetical protein
MLARWLIRNVRFIIPIISGERALEIEKQLARLLDV